MLVGCCAKTRALSCRHTGLLSAPILTPVRLGPPACAGAGAVGAAPPAASFTGLRRLRLDCSEPLPLGPWLCSLRQLVMRPEAAVASLPALAAAHQLEEVELAFARGTHVAPVAEWAASNGPRQQLLSFGGHKTRGPGARAARRRSRPAGPTCAARPARSVRLAPRRAAGLVIPWPAALLAPI